MSEVKMFNHEVFGELPVIEVEGKNYFGANEVAKSLQYAKPHKAVTDHCDEAGALTWGVSSPTGKKYKKFITIGNVSRLIVSAAKQSKNLEIREKAKEYEKWIFDEVLPSVHEHGAYMTGETLEKALTDPKFLVQLATTLKEEKEARIQAENKIHEQEPLVNFAESCLESDDSVLVREVAKLATEKGIKIGQNQLFEKLRDWNLIMKDKTEPKQGGVNRGYFEVSQGVKEINGEKRLCRTTRVTPRGQVYIINRIKKELEMAVV
ncbi:phage antirepressor KilAC domain-containing protein [Chengkuizengella marina]|uniref:Phage antirepressor Ant n=1 Tax=Chengkuizengella marina TaxID=2507566 RepID=A0A6N9Q250_9BACL|nr:phage antirepressor KilAC domain-containing protein [Chengkuizengella marina]NBI28590.1 phage antirepressor Ant [Chengkuizengella marina]